MLDEIIASKKEEVRTLQMPEHESVNRTSLKQALMSTSFDLSLIAEIKQASPSKGLLVTDLDVSKIAQTYENAGASAISVLTDSPFFKGEKRYIKQVKDLVHLPVLRKDFIIDEKQVEESYRLGADAILLIAGVVSNEKLQSLYEQAYDLGMECLVEVHNSEEALSLLDHVQPEIIGVNNRDLKTFRTDITHTESILKHLPKQSLVVSESGIRTRADLSYLSELGVQGVLMGETLMKADDQAQAIQSLFANEKAFR